MSPVMAAAAAIAGKLADVRKIAGPGRSSPVVKTEVHVAVSDPVEEELSGDDDLDRILDVPEDEPPTSSSAPAPSGGMAKFTVLKGIAAPLERANVDTDAIIPKQFLKTIKRTGLGSALFNQWRYDASGKENPDFVLNKEPYRQAKVLVVTGPNFGCGSSREHAPWALLDFGIRSILAPSFVSKIL